MRRLGLATIGIVLALVSGCNDVPVPKFSPPSQGGSPTVTHQPPPLEVVPMPGHTQLDLPSPERH